MARAKRVVVTEDLTREALNEIRDSERQALTESAPQAMNELTKRAPRDDGDYISKLFVEVPPRKLQMYLGNDARHAHLVEFGSGPRFTTSGAYRGEMPAIGVLRKSALKMRRVVLAALLRKLR